MKTVNYILMGLLFINVACSSKPPVNKIPPTANPTDEMAVLENELEDASQKNVDLLSPKNFQESQNYLRKAKEKFSKGKDSAEILGAIEYGQAYLTRANAAADLVRGNVANVLEARGAAIKANAPLYFEKDFNRVDNDFSELARNIESNKMSNVDSLRPKLQERYLNLEVKAIKETNMKDSRNIIEMAKNEEAKKYAPRMLAVADKSLKDLEEYIVANRHDRDGISRRSRIAIEDAAHALNITRMAKKTRNISPEEVALMMEREEQRVASKESELELTEDILKTTQSALKKEKTIQEQQAERAKELEEEKQALLKKKQELDAHKEIDERYNLARKEFMESEAEVYKSGDDILIRLKGMEFPPAKATLQSKNFSLLSKVKKIIDNFGEGAEVIVEGHTDSLGSAQVNHKLSSQRAEAVKDYLKSNLPGVDRIEAIGYGDERPIAGNKTAKGRAQNRRVDILIKTDSERF